VASNGTKRTSAPKKKREPAAPKAAKPPKPQKPPKRAAPAAPSVDKIAGVVRSLKSVGTYPPTVARVLELAEEDAAHAKKVVAKGFAGEHLLCAFSPGEKAAEAAWIFLAEDADAVVGAWIPAAIASLRDRQNRTGFFLKEIATVLPKPTSPTKVFITALEARGKEARWPPGVGSVRAGSEKSAAPLLFLLEDVTPPVAALAHAGDPAAFASAIERAFERLDRQHGDHNFVLLRALREALPDVPRDDFDAGLTALRLARRFTLEGSDGRHAQLADKDFAAGVRDGGTLLVYASRRRS
jgi:hypothetical protein